MGSFPLIVKIKRKFVIVHAVEDAVEVVVYVINRWLLGQFRVQLGAFDQLT